MHLLFYCLSFCGVLLHRCQAVSPIKESGFAISPISNFANSWAASAARSSVVALPVKIDEEQQAVILLFRTTEHIPNDNKSVIREINGLQLLDKVHWDSQIAAHQSKWTLLGPTTVCTMTGLASDIEFLTRCLQQSVENHRSVFDEATVSQSKPVPVFQLVESFCRRVREATLYEGSRPYGVQALFVGCDPYSASSLDIFTVDPSGSFQHWPRGTAIGRGSSSARKELGKLLLEAQKGTNNAKEMLRLAVQSSLEVDGPTAPSDFEALLIERRGKSLIASQVDPQQLESVANDMTINE